MCADPLLATAILDALRPPSVSGYRAHARVRGGSITLVFEQSKLKNNRRIMSSSRRVGFSYKGRDYGSRSIWCNQVSTLLRCRMKLSICSFTLSWVAVKGLKVGYHYGHIYIYIVMYMVSPIQ